MAKQTLYMIPIRNPDFWVCFVDEATSEVKWYYPSGIWTHRDDKYFQLWHRKKPTAPEYAKLRAISVAEATQKFQTMLDQESPA